MTRTAASYTDRLRDAMYCQIDCALEECTLTTADARRWETRVTLAETDGELAQICNELTEALWS